MKSLSPSAICTLAHAENRQFVDQFAPKHEDDWLIVCDDVGDSTEDVEWALSQLGERFAKVLWTPGNHELLSPRGENREPRGEFRYQRLVELC